ncbi:uncharacterized protein LOC121307898 [Polyodon spathula]|uniref:uncharacterized protein LOC121307898 n=1 Tax=Polyodon spathula TaxID=7913 RepID=UPI001B7ED670|nr:uncharacterized protein LOC121307898 [Polyodon spathula]
MQRVKKDSPARMNSFVIFTLLCTWSVFASSPRDKWTSKHCSSESSSLYDVLWDDSQVIADKTLETDFLKQMANGTLEAERYINFTLQDIYYLVKVTELLKALSIQPETHTDIKQFILDRYNSYKKFADYVLNQYLLKNADDIKPSTAIAEYIQSYNDVMKEDHIYFAVALLPCARLWLYVAEHLEITKGSPYYRFKSENEVGHPEKHYKDLLENHRSEIDESKAKNIFQKHMKHEYNFFRSS